MGHLSLTRAAGESFVIITAQEEQFWVQVQRIKGKTSRHVVLRITAEDDCEIWREEVYRERVKEES